MGTAGIVLLSVCLYAAVEKRTFTKTAIQVSGTVVELRDAGDASRAVISFHDQQGHSHRLISKVASSPPRFEHGESVQVLFPPGHPDQARIDSFFENWFVSLITGGIGFALSLGSFLAWRFRERMFPQYKN
jgi:hypothetical protein